MIRLSFVIFSSLIFLFNTAFSQTIAPVSISDSAWIKPYEPFRVAGNIYYVGTYDLASYLITTTRGNILINTGLAESVPMIKKNIEQLGFKCSDIKVLLTTQAHFDHVAGLAEIQKETGAKMMVDEADAKVLGDGGMSDFIWGGELTFAPVKVDRILHDKDTIKLGETILTMLHHPGHTKGSCSFILDTKDEKRSWRVLIANIPSILPPSKLLGMETYPNVGKDYAYTLSSMKKLKFDLWVASHASQFDLHEKRKAGDPYKPEMFVDQKGYDASINDIQKQYDKRLKEEKASKGK